MPRQALIALAALPPVFSAMFLKLGASGEVTLAGISLAFFAGWISLGFVTVQRRWLKVALLLAYPVVMFVAILFTALLLNGLPGGPF